MSDVTRLLTAAEAGDPRAAELLPPLVVDERRKLAAARLAITDCVRSGQGRGRVRRSGDFR